MDLRKDWPALLLGAILLAVLVLWLHSRCPVCQQRLAAWLGQRDTSPAAVAAIVNGKVPAE